MSKVTSAARPGTTRDDLARRPSNSSSSGSSNGTQSTAASSTYGEKERFFDTPKQNEAWILKQEDMVEHLKRCIIRQKLTKFYDVTNDKVLGELDKMAQRLCAIPNKFKLEPEIVFDLAFLALYDLCILIDDSGSMRFYEQGTRVDSLKNALKSITALYGALVPDQREIKIRYVNEAFHRKKLPTGIKPAKTTPEFDESEEMVPEEDSKAVDDLVGKIPFDGLTQLGDALQKYVLEPYVYMGTRSAQAGKLRNIGKMRRPLQVLVVTDGEIEGEDESKLPDAIYSVVRSAKKCKHTECAKAVVFQFSRVGHDSAAEKYLQYLDKHEKIGGFIDSHPSLEIGEVMNIKKAKSAEEKKNMIKLLIGAIKPTYDVLDEVAPEPSPADSDQPAEDEDADQPDADDEDINADDYD